MPARRTCLLVILRLGGMLEFDERETHFALGVDGGFCAVTCAWDADTEFQRCLCAVLLRRGLFFRPHGVVASLEHDAPHGYRAGHLLSATGLRRVRSAEGAVPAYELRGLRRLDLARPQVQPTRAFPFVAWRLGSRSHALLPDHQYRFVAVQSLWQSGVYA